MSNRLCVTPRYCGVANPLGCGDKYGGGVCSDDVREMLWWLGAMVWEMGVLVKCSIPGYYGGSWREGGTIGAASTGSKVRGDHHPEAVLVPHHPHCRDGGCVVAFIDERNDG